MQDAQTSIASNPNYAKAYYRQASALRYLERLEDGIKFLETAPEVVRKEPEIASLLKGIQDELKFDRLLLAGTMTAHD